jgi:tetratricopeptide (TPR) repeat protein
MNAPVKLTFVVAAAVSLGGCQSFPLTSWMFKKDRPAVEEHQLAGNTAGALEEGGAFLREGNLSAAVASYRIALLDRATRADASNGLGVAYAKLGRDDLAARYFMGAIDAEPDNPKYVANLLRLQQQVFLARRVDDIGQGEALAATASAAALSRQADAGAAGSRTSDLVERISRGEVQIRTRPDLGNAPRMAVAFASRPSGNAERSDEVNPEKAQATQYPPHILFAE